MGYGSRVSYGKRALARASRPSTPRQLYCAFAREPIWADKVRQGSGDGSSLARQ